MKKCEQVAVFSSHGRQANDDATRAGGRDVLAWAVVDAMRAGGGDVIARPVGGRRCGKSGWWTITSSNEREQRTIMGYDERSSKGGRSRVESGGGAAQK
jgi:hypothetical protein